MVTDQSSRWRYGYSPPNTILLVPLGQRRIGWTYRVHWEAPLVWQPVWRNIKVYGCSLKGRGFYIPGVSYKAKLGKLTTCGAYTEPTLQAVGQHKTSIGLNVITISLTKTWFCMKLLLFPLGTFLHVNESVFWMPNILTDSAYVMLRYLLFLSVIYNPNVNILPSLPDFWTNRQQTANAHPPSISSWFRNQEDWIIWSGFPITFLVISLCSIFAFIHQFAYNFIEWSDLIQNVKWHRWHFESSFDILHYVMMYFRKNR